MNKLIILIVAFVLNLSLNAQSVYIDNISYISLKDGGNLYVKDTSVNAIYSSGGGFYVPDNGKGYLEWNIQNNTGNYVIPFLSTNDSLVPITVSITSPGIGTSIKFSNIDIPGQYPSFWDPNSIKRYWTLDFDSFSFLPTGTITLKYLYSDVPLIYDFLVLKYYKDVYSGVWTNNELSTVNYANHEVVLPINQYLNTLNSNHTWSLINPVSALPVTLLFFKGENKENKYSNLTWETALEINNSGFKIERSLDGINFDSIGWVSGHVNSTVSNSYFFNDYSIQRGNIYYYRLKQVDLDGNFEYSDIISVNFSLENQIVEYYSLTGQKINFTDELPSGVYLKVVNNNAKLFGIIK